MFVSTFWNTLLFQASLNEPAVWHAVLTLSSVHKRGALNGNNQGRREDTPDKPEQFTLQHYLKAISHLQPNLSNHNRASVRVALITCVVFVCLELLRGHFQTAQNHLQNGLKVLRETQMLSIVLDDSDDDGWIVEAFSRLHVQVVLFNQSHHHPCFVLQDSGAESPVPLFHNLNEAWQQMERLLNKIIHLANQGRRERVSETLSLAYPSTLFGHQQRIQTELTRWLDTYEVSRKDLQSQQLVVISCQLLCTYHTMAKIMLDACSWPDDESIFDSYTEQFLVLINQLLDIWKIRTSGSQVRAWLGHPMDMSRSVVDIGWIPPLYYTALKCRVHRVRLHAIRLLESSAHREGFWDANIAACVARKVMEIEERDFYSSVDTGDDFLLFSSPEWQDLSLQTIPQSYRINEVEVVLPDGPKENVFLFCRQKQSGGGWKVLRKEFHALSQSWMDGTSDEEAGL
jgi:hypothetical protein